MADGLVGFVTCAEGGRNASQAAHFLMQEETSTMLITLECSPTRNFSSPLALAENRYTPAVGVNAVDVNLVRADHPVDMDEALVAALRRDLLGRQLLAADEAFRIALAERDMTGGVLVEQGVEEQ